MKHVISGAVFFMALIGMTAIPSAAQQAAIGMLPNNSYGGGPFDAVNLGNLNVHFCVPIRHKAGRGMPFAYDLCYDNTLWQVVTSGSSKSWQPISKVGSVGSYWGWQGLGPVYSAYVSFNLVTSIGTCYNNQGYQTSHLYNYVYYDLSGAPHPAPALDWTTVSSPGGSGCPAPGTFGTFTGTTSDGSGYLINWPSTIVTKADGTTLSVPFFSGIPTGSTPYTGTDRNGNKITFSNGTYTDTLGQVVLTAAGTQPSPTTFTYTGPSGNVSYTVSYKPYNISTNFNCSGVTDYTASNIYLVDKITLPDTAFYQFAYEQTTGAPSGTVTGRVASVMLPTGGQIAYQYPTWTQNSQTYNVANCADGTAPAAAGTNEQYSLQRTLNGGTWKYSRTQVSGNHWQTTITTPTSDNTLIDFMQDSATTSTYSFYETQRQVNQLINGVQTLLVTTLSCWNNTPSACTTTAISSPISEHAVTTQYPNGVQSKTDVNYSTTGLVGSIQQYAYGTGAPGPRMRLTSIIYGSWNGTSCTNLSNNISDRVCNVTVTDTYGGTNYPVSYTTYTYDESTPQSTTNTPQQASITGSRGNATTVQTALSWNGSGVVSSSLNRHFKYYDTGNVYMSQDVNGQWTTYNYSTVAQGNTTQSCGNSFPTSFTLPISGLSTSASTSYDCGGGVVTGVTDPNGNTTTTTFTDPYYWRPAQVSAPYVPGTSTTTNLTYTTTSVDSRMAFNGTSSVAEAQTTIGAFGQVLYSQRHEGPNTSDAWDTTEARYDSLLRPYQSTMPCVTSVGSGCPSASVTTSTFDALGRVTQLTDGGNPTPGWIKYTYNQNDVLQEAGPAPSNENTKQKQLEYDALGRLTSVCEITNLTGAASCGQVTGGYTGYVTTYAYGVNSSGYPTMTVTQGPVGSQQTRVYTYDLLGRLVSEQNPENGTTTYTYDSGASSCPGSYIGDVVQRKDAANSVRCYTYDAMHRLTSITYPGTTTDSRYFVYDGATVNQATMQNAKGKLAEAYTCPSSGSCSPHKTDIGFSYSPRGEVIDAYESTPNSGGYYHTSATYWEDGVLQNLMNTIAGLPNVSYGVDPAGRPSTATATTNH